MTASAPLASGWMTAPVAAWLALACHPDCLAAGDPGAARTASLTPRTTLSAASSPAADFRRHYEEALATGAYLEAETAAKQLIEHLADAGDGNHGPMADALGRLAFVQRQRQLFEPALQNYRAAIALLEDGENRLSASLVEPLAALGDTYMASGRPELALPAYDQALHVRQVNSGPHALEQVEILDAMATALADSGDTENALRAADRMYYLYARAFAPDSEEVLPALERKARLLKRFERYADERMVYREVVRIIQDRRGEHDLSLLDAYSALGRTYFHDFDDVYFRSEPTTETAETFFRRAVEVTEANPAATWRMQKKALLELADYYTLRDVQDKARIHYRRAWELMSADEERLEPRRRDLGRVVPLLGANLDPFANFGYRSSAENADPGDYKEGYVVARFTVNDRGRVTDVQIADADPAGFAAMETRIRQAVRGLVYRPRYEEGGPVATPGQLFRHEYRYLDRDLATAP